MKQNSSVLALVFGTVFLAFAVVGVVNTYQPMPPMTIVLVLSATLTGSAVLGLIGLAVSGGRRSRRGADQRPHVD